MSLLTLCEQLQNSAFGTTLRESLYLFPIVETIHVLALGLSVGTILYFDLRLVGIAFRSTSVSRVFQEVRPWMGVGFAAMVITGVLLFSAHAMALYGSIYFRIKVVLLGLAGLNVATFHLTVDRRRAEWDLDLVPPPRARLAGAVSIVLWLGVITAGRFTAYNLV